MRIILLAPLLLTLAACTRDHTDPAAHPPGAKETAKTDLLEAGAKALQDNGPVAKLDIHLVGFHPMKDHPHQQMEAHHFCRQVNQDFAQCALFDGDSAQANLTGVEYIISESCSSAWRRRSAATGIRTTARSSPGSCRHPACRRSRKRN